MLAEYVLRQRMEAEWEWACRAGTTTAFFSGDQDEEARPFCWCSEPGRFGSAGQTKPAGTLLPNAWGLFDMHGNIWEWCSGRSGPYLVGDGVGPAEGEDRMLRGGCWFSPGWCRSAVRTDRQRTGYRDSGVGFRACMVLD